MGDSISRRAVLAASAAGASALAGCGGQGGNGGNGGGGDDAPLLSTLRLANSTDQALTVHLVVERNDDFVHWSTQRLGPQNGGADAAPAETTVERTWSDDTGEFVINARLDQRSEGRTVDLSELSGDPNCWGIELEVTQNGDFNVWTTEDPEGCPIGGGNGNNES